MSSDGLLLRGAEGSLATVALPYSQGSVTALFDAPFDMLAAAVVVTRQLRFDMEGAVGAQVAAPFDILGHINVRVGLPFDVLDGYTGVDDFGNVLVPLLGWYEPD